TISTILGIVVGGFNIPVPELVTDSLELLAATAIPLALFSVGIAIHPALASIRSGGLSLGMVFSGFGLETIIFPLASFGLASVLHHEMQADLFNTLMLTAAMAMSTSGYILSARYDASGDFAAGVLAGTTILSILTVPVLAAVLP